MDIVYQITTKDTRAYAGNIAACDTFCKRFIDKGIIPNVKRMRKSQVPLSDIELVTGL